MLLVVEGPNGVGKSLQLAMLGDHLRACGEDPLLTREPGGTPVGCDIRREILGSTEVRKCTELYGMLFDRALHWDRVVIPALARGRTVLCDRMCESTIVYQGMLGTHDVSHVRQLSYGVLPAEFFPKMTAVIFDAPDDVLDDRLRGKGSADDKFDQASKENLARERFAYREISRQPAPYRRVQFSAEDSVEEVHRSFVALFRGLSLP